jgi:hypothetical protein
MYLYFPDTLPTMTEEYRLRSCENRLKRKAFVTKRKERRKEGRKERRKEGSKAGKHCRLM